MSRAKNFIKKSPTLWKWYLFCGDRVLNFYGKYFPEANTKRLFRKNNHPLDLENPVGLNDKLQYLKLHQYKHHPLVTQCADKYRVRDYIKQLGCEELLVDLYGAWDCVDEIDWNVLPKKFVLKCNHGCGYNIVCTDKDTFDFNDAKEKLNKWMHESYGEDHSESCIYGKIKRKIIAEQFIESEDGKPINDFKFFCSYGEPKYAYLITGGHGDEMCLDYYTTDWEWIPARNGKFPNAKEKREKPKMLQEMLQYASVLSEQFPLVRVDLYCEFGKIYFGELTFLATSGLSDFIPYSYNETFGKMIPIDTRSTIHMNQSEEKRRGNI